MGKIKNLFASLKNSFGRFAGMYMLCFLAAFFLTLYVFNFGHEKIFVPLALDFSFMMVASVLLRLAFEKIFPIENSHSKSARIWVNVIPILLSAPFYFLCRMYNDDYFSMAYCLCVVAMFFGILYFLEIEAKEKNLPNIIASGFVALVLCLCVGGSFSLILFAVNTLIFSMDILNYEILLEMFWIFSLYMVFVGAAVSFSTKKYEEITISKAFKVIFNYAILPLFFVYLLVLYVYFLKSIFTRTMPSGMINPFVSVAAAVYMVLYFSLELYKNSLTKIFYRLGAFLLFPLVGFQIFGFVIRVSAYGFTPPRYFSLVYIFVSSVFLVLAIVKNISHKNFRVAKIIFPLVSLISILICIPKINVIDFCNQSMRRQIEKIYEDKGLFENGKLVTNDAANVFSAKEKNQIRDIDGHIVDGKSIPWYKENFESSYGFENRWYKEDDLYDFGCDFIFETEKLNLDVSSYRTLKKISSSELTLGKNPKLIVHTESVNGNRDSYIVDDMSEYLERPFNDVTTHLDEPIFIDIDEDTRLVLTRLLILHDGESGTYVDRYVYGYVLIK